MSNSGIRNRVFKNKFSENRYIGDYTGLWYLINEETIELTESLYEQHIGKFCRIENYLNNVFLTNKFAVFIKKGISGQVFELLKVLHLMRMSKEENSLVVSRNLLNEYVVEKFNGRYGQCVKVRFINSFASPLILLRYVFRCIKELMKRGISWRKERPYFKIFKEAIWGFNEKTCRDDMLIDGKIFKKEDILLGEFNTEEWGRKWAFAEAKRRGFARVSVPHLPINIRSNFLELFYLYLVTPLKLYFILLGDNSGYLLRYIITRFFLGAFPVEVLVNNFNIGISVSGTDYDDIARTIIFNRYGIKNVLFHWSDLSSYKSYIHAFIAHNIYFCWGNAHYDLYEKTRLVDKRVNIGCIFKSEVQNGLKNKAEIMDKLNLVAGKEKVVAFYDTSFNRYIHSTEEIYLEFIQTVREYCIANPDRNVILKSKKGVEGIKSRMMGENYQKFKNLWDDLLNKENFIHLDPPEWGVEEPIAVADVNIGMGINSCASIALICGRNALYYDKTGNNQSLFTRKYSNSIVFDNRNQLYKQIENILSGKFSPLSTIDNKEIRNLDTFDDNDSIKRIRNYLSDLLK